MTTASNHHLGSAAGGDRTWVLVVAAAGWAVLTTVAVLLATGTLSVGRSPVVKPSQTQTPGTDQNNPDTNRNQKVGRTPVPRQRTPYPAPRMPTSRADRERLVYAASPMAMIPRQASAHDR